MSIQQVQPRKHEFIINIRDWRHASAIGANLADISRHTEPPKNSVQMISKFPILRIIICVVVTLSFLIFLLRINSAISFDIPKQLTTSGWEHESLFAIWKFIHGMPVYADPMKLPYALSFYNWLFYESYGILTKIFLELSSLDDAWLPTITRLITLGFCMFGSCVLFVIFRDVTGQSSTGLMPHWPNAVFSFFVFFGPLTGYWAFTTRSDVPAMALDTLAILVAVRMFQKRSFWLVLLCAIICYVAWAFKQTAITVPISVALCFIFVRRDFSSAVLFVGVTWTAYGLTFLFGSSEYMDSVLFATTNHVFSIATFLRNNVLFAGKMAPFAIGFVVVAAMLVRNRHAHKNEIGDFLLIGSSVSLLLALATSGKTGGADNYFFTTAVWHSALVVWAFSRFSGQELLYLKRAFLFGWFVVLLGVLAVALGVRGSVNAHQTTSKYNELRECAKGVRQPVYIDNQYMHLPWMNPSPIPIIDSWNYEYYRSKGSVLEYDGIGGLLDRGYFGSVLISPDRNRRLDGSEMKKYQFANRSCGGLLLYERRPGIPGFDINK